MPLRSPFSVQYLNTAAISRLASSNSLTILGVIGYGSDRPASLSQSCPFVRADLLPLGGAPLFETWCAPSGVSYHTSGAIHGASTDDLIFGVVELDRTSGISLQTGIANAYAGIFDFLRDHGFQAPLRFWNYLPKITIDEDGLERYRRFNIGRYDAFSARLLLPVPPVASAVGGQGGVPMIYFLGGRVPAKQLENPRQVSAFHYPPVYGPRSPQFSRASIFEANDARSLLISGTASIVGHESLHQDDPVAQVAETLANISALIGAAGQDRFGPQRGHWALKAYIRDPAHLDIVRGGVDEVFGSKCERIFLHADMCRPELLVEIEALCLAGNEIRVSGDT